MVLADENAMWYQCKSDDDCMIAYGVCSTPVAINRRYVKEFELYIQKQSERGIPCNDPTPEWEAWSARVQVRCLNGHCVLWDPHSKQTSAAKNSTYKISGKNVTQTEFEVALSKLTMVPESQINGESSRGLHTSYTAKNVTGQIFKISIDGHQHDISKLP